MVAPWYGARGTAYVARATAEAIAPPVVMVSTVPGDGTRVVTLDISSARHAPRLAIVWHSDAELVALRINGVTPPRPPGQRPAYLAPGWDGVTVYGSTAHVEITLRGNAPAEAVVMDISFGLPRRDPLIALLPFAIGQAPSATPLSLMPQNAAGGVGALTLEASRYSATPVSQLGASVAALRVRVVVRK
jgi:hypothetical protein